MTYEFKCGTCGRLKEIRSAALAPNPDCDFCQERMHRVYTFVLHWPKENRGH